MARARAKLAILTSPDNLVYMTVAEAIKKFKAQQIKNGRSESTLDSYKTTFNFLDIFCAQKGIVAIAEIAIATLDEFRDSCVLAQSTSRYELKRLRCFFGFCFTRHWCADNPAKAIDLPPEGTPDDIIPYTASEIADIKEAARTFGKRPYERLQVVAMILTLRCTALRISDVVILRRDRIMKRGRGWKILLRAMKNGKQIFLPIPNAMKVTLDNLPLPRGADQNCP